MKKLKQNLPIMIGCFMIIGLVAFSFIYTYFIKDTLKPPPTFLYNDEGKMIGTYGYPPSLTYPFGVDRFGRDVFWMVVDGAKYTIAIALVVAIIRVVFGILFGIFYGFTGKKFETIVNPFINAFRFVPAVIIVLPIFQMLQFGVGGNQFRIISLQILLISFIAIPILTSTIGDEVKEFLKNDFILSSKVIGAGNMWLRRKHVFPFLRTRILLLFVQQTIQVLFLLTQLGVFRLFIGGAVTLFIDDGDGRDMSKANEWAAMIGSNFFELSIDPWVIIGPSIAFIVTIFAFNLIKLGIERMIHKQQVPTKQFKHHSVKDFGSLNDFDFVNNTDGKTDLLEKDQSSFVLSK
ncbi:ABC transporter permease [Bacillus sp. OAE603]|uniref:ABC transporter permease n=1 Tax=Gottfriedia sp. OAE603 TaxID=2663872 RepID=UPI001789FC63